MEHVIVDVDPFELDIEWDIDEANLARLVKDIEENRRVEMPVDVWVTTDGNYRIAEGFHRTKAAQITKAECGYPKTIPVHLCGDMSEARFWELRIMSARQHKPITATRLRQWISEVWKNSPISSNHFIEVLDAYRLELQQQAGKSVVSQYKVDRDGLAQINQWIHDMARQWDISSDELANIVVEDHIFKNWDLSTGEKKFVTRYFDQCDVYGLWSVINARRQAVEDGEIPPQQYKDARTVIEAAQVSGAYIDELESETLVSVSRRAREEVVGKREVVEKEELYEKRRRRHRSKVDKKTVLHLEDVALWLEQDANILGPLPFVKAKAVELIPRIIAACADMWGEPFSVWAKYITPQKDVRVLPEHMALSSSDFEKVG